MSDRGNVMIRWTLMGKQNNRSLLVVTVTVHLSKEDGGDRVTFYLKHTITVNVHTSLNLRALHISV